MNRRLAYILSVIVCGFLLALAICLSADAEAAAEWVKPTPTPTPTPEPVVIAWPSPNASQLGLVEDPEPSEEPQRVSLGIFTVTAYCPCAICCGKWSNPEDPTTASGAPAVEGITVGADWATLPAGTAIEIEGVGIRTVQDKPAGWIVDKYEGRILDLYFARHEDAWNFGKRKLEIWIIS